MLSTILRVVLVAFSLGLDVFAVCVGVGIGRPTTAAKIRIGLSFALAELVMNVVGALIGGVVGRAIGDPAAYVGYAALVGVGIYMVVESLRAEDEAFDLSHGWGLFLASLSISLDSLGIGFTIVYIGVPVVVTLGAIVVASIVSSGLGLAFGERFGAQVGEKAGLFAGVVLIGTGVLFVALKFAHLG